MKTWFPFTDYDFYAYITAGMLLIATADYTFAGSMLISRTDWTAVQITFWTAIAYLLGQVVAGPSSALFEHLVARRFLYPPAAVVLGLKERRWRERITAALFASREYAPFPAPMRSKILTEAAKSLDVSVDSLKDAEAVFGIAFGKARKSSDAAARMDQFRNLYGFSRNISFVGLIATACLAIKPPDIKYGWGNTLIIAGSIILTVGMFGRFIKFYAAYSQELFRAYVNSTATDKPGKPSE